MEATELISRIHPAKGVTSIVKGVMSGDFDPIKGASAVYNLDAAKAALNSVIQKQNNCKSDWAFWGYEGDKAYLGAIVQILEAEQICGKGNLPDLPFETDAVVVMDMCSAVSAYGKRVMELAKTNPTEL